MTPGYRFRWQIEMAAHKSKRKLVKRKKKQQSYEWLVPVYFVTFTLSTWALSIVSNSEIPLNGLALIAQLVECWPAELRVVGSIPVQGRQECWRGKLCSRDLSSMRDVRPWVSCFENSVRVKEPFGEQNYPCGVTHRHGCFVTLNSNQRNL